MISIFPITSGISGGTPALWSPAGILKGTQSAEDLRGQSQQEELRGDGGAKGEALGVFTFSVFTFQRK